MASTSVATSLEASVEARLSSLQAHAQAQLWKPQPFTIFRVPTYVRESNRTAYEPRMVSIGPYYHGSPSLRTMEDHKWRYLQEVLARDGAPSSATLIEMMRSLEAQARACYSESPLLDSDDFVRMLLLDGCFIIEFMLKWHHKMPDALCDAIDWGPTLVYADLLLLENQIPFFVVERLYGAVAGRESLSLPDLLLEYVSDEEPIARPPATCEIRHLLHLYYESFVPKRSSPTCRKTTAATPTRCIPRAKEMSAAGVTFVRQSSAQDVYAGRGVDDQSEHEQDGGDTAESPIRGIPRATEMSAAGVTFVPRRKAEDVYDYDVNFLARRGVMEIPVVRVDDMTKRPLLVNLIAFEQTKGEQDPCGVVTSYVSLMSMLIRGKDDVELLRRLNILENMLADDDEAARFFSHLGDGVVMNYREQVITGLYEDVREYCGSWRHRNRAALMRDYFGSPWSAISVVVAAIVVALTATQTYFTAFPAQK